MDPPRNIIFPRIGYLPIQKWMKKILPNKIIELIHPVLII